MEKVVFKKNGIVLYQGHIIGTVRCVSHRGKWHATTSDLKYSSIRTTRREAGEWLLDYLAIEMSKRAREVANQGRT